MITIQQFGVSAKKKTSHLSVQTSTGKKVGATGALETNVKASSQTVEDLRPTVNYQYRDHPAKLAEWIYAAKVESHTPTAQSKKPPTH